MSLDSNVVKQVFQKHGITTPCPMCKNNHVPAATWRDTERRCRANVRQVCVCCDRCEERCDGSSLAAEVAS